MKSPEQIASDIVNGFVWTSNVRHKGMLVSQQIVVAEKIADAVEQERAEIQRLRARVTDLGGHLMIALREWKLYSEMAECNDGFDLATDKSQEGDLYRAAFSSAHEQKAPGEEP